MSYRVLVIPEDPKGDAFILKPLVAKVMELAQKRRADVRICHVPNFGGYGGLLSFERVKTEVLNRYQDVDLFLIFADRDGDPGRDIATENLRNKLQNHLDENGRSDQKVLCELARQEVEVFPLAGHPASKNWPWQEIRSDPHVKDSWFRKLAIEVGTIRLVDGGRGVLMSAAMKNWSRIKSRCPEETVGLAAKIKAL
jgi:hypothetical protein